MELEIIRAIQSISNPFLDILFQIFTMFGEELILISIITTIYWAYDKKFGEYVAYSSLTSLLFNNAVKDIFKMKRPIGEEGIRTLRAETATGYSFPSGHSQGAASFYGSIAIHFKKKIIYILAAIIIFLVGISRLYLGVHYPKDVVVGIIFGLIIAIITYKLFNSVNNRNVLYIITFLCFIPALVFAQSPDFIKGMGTYLGFVLGIIVEKRYINFSVEGNLSNKVLRVVIGIAILLVIKSGLKLIFPDELIFHFIRYTVVTFVGIGVYPSIFKKFKI
ncbi:Undecaprenyl-diphosphatase BcrC [uncultured Clostridium sp.]|uniref:phosphatase PAP2 family protein n=1 Tax=uncultured Clostridium sp. TaxID=59620 RepID=UPI000821A7ED|nr:phosphatase PAP2 family protein [uncultured Clostridium sp.]SCI77071.1 Undecaprenyl-diphosphatase BcrC [uncultured Clostridium sp.]